MPVDSRQDADSVERLQTKTHGAEPELAAGIIAGLADCHTVAFDRSQAHDLSDALIPFASVSSIPIQQESANSDP